MSKAVKPRVNKKVEPVNEPLVENKQVTDDNQVATGEQPATENGHANTEANTETKAKAPRVQVNKSIGINIPPPRVRTYLDKMNINSFIEEKLKPLNDQLDSIKEDPTKADQVKILRDEIALYNGEKFRFSEESAICLAVVLDEVVKEVATVLADKTVSVGKKTIQSYYFPGVDALKYGPLIRGFDQFPLPPVKEEPAKDAAANTQPVNNQPATDQPVAEQPTESTEEDKYTFKSYTQQACKDLIATKDSTLKIASDVKVILSDMVVYIIHRLSPYIYFLTCAMKNKTVSEYIIMKSVEMLLADGSKPEGHFELGEKEVKTKDKADPSKVTTSVVKSLTYTVSYPGSGFNELSKVVDDKLAVYKESSKKKQAEA